MVDNMISELNIDPEIEETEEEYNSLESQLLRHEKALDEDRRRSLKVPFVNPKKIQERLLKPDAIQQRKLQEILDRQAYSKQFKEDLRIDPNVAEEISGHHITGGDEPPEESAFMISPEIREVSKQIAKGYFGGVPFSQGALQTTELEKTQKLLGEARDRKREIEYKQQLDKILLSPEEFPEEALHTGPADKSTMEAIIKLTGLGHLATVRDKEQLERPHTFIGPAYIVKSGTGLIGSAVQEAIDKANLYPGSTAEKTAIFVKYAAPAVADIAVKSAKALAQGPVELAELVHDIGTTFEKYAPVALGYTLGHNPAGILMLEPAKNKDWEEYGTSLWSDMSDLFFYSDKRFGGWNRHVEKRKKAAELTRAMLPDNVILEMIGARLYGTSEKESKALSGIWKSIKDAIIIPEEEMTDFYRGLVMAGMFMTWGGGRSVLTMANSFLRNTKKAKIIADVTKGTGTKYPSVRVYTDTRLFKQQLPEEEAYWNRIFNQQKFKGENVKDSMMSDRLIRQKYEQMLALHGDPEKAAKFTKSLMQDYHMGVSAMAGTNAGMLITNFSENDSFTLGDVFTPKMDINSDGVIIEQERKEYQANKSYWPEILGMVGAFAYPTIGQKIIGKNIASLTAKIGGSKTLSAVGTFIAYTTAPEKMINLWKGKGISPIKALENPTRAALLYSKGFTRVDLQRMEQRAIKEASSALRIRDELSPQGGFVKNNAERDAITDQLKQDKILNRDGSVNKWRYAEEYAEKNVKAQHIEYLKNLRKFIDELPEESRQQMKDSIEASFKALDDLAEKVPASLGNVDFLLGNILQLNVVQSLKEVLTQKVNASTISGKMITNFSLIPDIQKYARQEADLIKSLAEVALKHGKSKDATENQFYDSLEQLTNASSRQAAKTNAALEALIKKEGLAETDVLQTTPDEVNQINKLLQITRNISEDNFSEIGIKNLGVSIRQTFFGENNKGGLYGRLVDDSNKAYDKVKSEAKDLNQSIDIEDAIDILADPELPSGVSQAIASILNKSPVNLKIIKQLKKTSALNTIKEITDVVGDDLKKQIELLNDRLLRGVNNEEAMEIAARLELGLTTDQLKGVKDDLINKILENDAAPFTLSMSDFVELRRTLTEISRRDLESGKTANQTYFNLSSVIKALNNTLEDHPALSDAFKEANENWQKTILPFRDSESAFYKLFMNRNPNTGRISSEDLLLEIIKHPNQEATQKAYNEMTKNMNDEEKEHLARLFVYSIGNGMNRGSITDRHLEKFMSEFHQVHENGFSIFKKTDVENYANALRAKGKESLLVNEKNLEVTEKASIAIQKTIAEFKSDKELDVPMRIINEYLGTGLYGTTSKIDPTTFIKAMLGDAEAMGARVISQPVTKDKFIDSFRSTLRDFYGFDKIDEFIQNTPRLKKIEQSIIDAYSITEDGVERFIPILFIKNHLKNTLSDRHYNNFIENLKVLATDEILKIGFPPINSAEMSVVMRHVTDIRRTLAKRNAVPEYQMEEVIKGIEQNNPDIMNYLKKNGLSRKDFFKTEVNFDRDIDPLAMSTMLNNKRSTLLEIFGEEHLEILDSLIAPMSMIRNLKESGSVAMGSIQGEWTVPQFLGKANSVVRGFLSPRYAITEFGIVHLRQSRFEIMRQLFSDKIFAKAFRDIFEAGQKGTGVPEESLKYWSAKMIAIQSSVQARLENEAERNGIPHSALYEKYTSYTIPRILENPGGVFPFSLMEEYKEQDIYSSPPINNTKDLMDFLPKWLFVQRVNKQRAEEDKQKMREELKRYSYSEESELNIDPKIQSIIDRKRILEQEYEKPNIRDSSRLGGFGSIRI